MNDSDVVVFSSSFLQEAAEKMKMADELGVEPSRILYVGNSLKYDVRGSHNAGMKCAYLLPFWRRIFNKPLKEAEISFSNYRQLLNIVLE